MEKLLELRVLVDQKNDTCKFTFRFTKPDSGEIL